MADYPEQNRQPPPTRRNPPNNSSRPPSYSYSTQTNNERNRVPSDNQYESQDYQRFLVGSMRSAGDTGSIRSMDSRFSMNEQFAASRRDFEFDMESDTESILEPAPIIHEPTDDDDIPENSARNEPELDDDAASDISEAEILRLMDADDNGLDYYTILSLPKDPPPTTAQIRTAYHRLSLAFHPDKQPPALKAAAERHFSRIQKAYETLVEPRKRVIYDLEGEEGVEEEYKVGGAMGKGGEKDLLEVGVKTLSPSEFKAWFMNVLKKREQRAVEALVGSSGSIVVRLDGSGSFTGRVVKYKDPETDTVVRVPAPRIEVRSLNISHDFLVPLSGASLIYERSLQALNDLVGRDTDMPVEELHERSWEAAAYENSPTLSISTGIEGAVVQKVEFHRIEDEKESLLIQNAVMVSTEFTIGAGISHKFPDADINDSKGASLLAGSEVSFSTTFLPRQTYRLGITRRFILLENTRPFFVAMEANQIHDMMPPELSATITRPISNNSSVFCRLHSGGFLWPSWVTNIMERFSLMPKFFVTSNNPSSVQLGWLYAENTGDHAGPDGTPIPRSPHSSNEKWQVSLNAWSTTMGIRANYGRDLFSRSQKPPVRSRIMNSGEALPTRKPQHKDVKTGVRLELETNLDIDMSLSWNVQGVKRIGDFTTMGFGIGVHFSSLQFIFSWSRLGQDIRIPIMILPSELLNSRAVFFSLAFPWGLYATYEFLILRPAERRARRRLLRQKRKELRASVERKKEQALQAVELMATQVAYKQALESENDGLVILEARYGSPSLTTQKAGMGEFVPGEVVDVTIPLAGLVEGGQLVLNKKVDRNGILGFYDPVPLGRKGLGVRYLFGGKVHEVFVGEKEGLVLPQREHELRAQ